MADLSVCCVCLTADRQRFTTRAIECFLAQTAKCWMLLYDTGETPYYLDPAYAASGRIVTVYNPRSRGRLIGRLRNEAIDLVGHADVIVTWDSDDWSAPERITQQLGQLMASGEVAGVGYTNMLFLDTRGFALEGAISEMHGHMSDAWEYDYKAHNRVVGSSLVYWRRAWERQPFSETVASGEDTYWHKVVPIRGFNGVENPLLIAEVHGANTSPVYAVFDRYSKAYNPEWRRAPEFDQLCREKLYP